jgi:hypothetical protein
MLMIFPYLLSALLFQPPSASTIIVTKSDGIQMAVSKQRPNEQWTAVRTLAAGAIGMRVSYLPRFGNSVYVT